MSTLAAILNSDPKPVSDIVPGIPPEIEKLVRKCLRKDPGRRYQHMDDLKLALEELKEESDSGTLQRHRNGWSPESQPEAAGYCRCHPVVHSSRSCGLAGLGARELHGLANRDARRRKQP